MISGKTKKVLTSRLAVFLPTRPTGNNFLIKGGLIYINGIVKPRIQLTKSPPCNTPPQVGLYEGTTFTHNLCLNCEIQVGMIEEYYKVLEKFRKNFAHTASYYGLELVPLPEAQKTTYQFVQTTTQQAQLPTFSQVGMGCRL